MKLNKKIVLHNLTFKGIEVVPGVLDFDQRGVVYTNPGDIVITKNSIDEDYLRYLQDLGWDFSGCVFLNPAITDKCTYNNSFHDPEIISKIAGVSDHYLDTYNATTEEEEFAKKIHKYLYADCGLSQLYGTKSGFRKLAKELGLTVAQGFENITNINDLKKSVESLIDTGKMEIAIKVDEGISGAGITKIKSADYKNLTDVQRTEFLQNALNKLQQAQSSSGVSVEEWIQNVIASPSVQVEVFPDKSWQIMSMHDQLLEGEEKWYVGCVYPERSLDKANYENVIADVKKYTNFLLDKDFVGFFGLDLIVTKEARYYWVEANMRKPGTFYPRIIAQKLNNGTLDNIVYIATDFTIPSYRGISFNRLKKEFADLLFSVNGKFGGVVLYNTGALKEAGRFDLVCISRDETELSEIYKEVRLKVDKLKQTK